MDLFEKSHRLYKRLRIFWFIAMGASLLALIPEAMNPYMGVALTIGHPLVAIFGLLLALPGMLYWYRASKRVLALETLEEKLAAHEPIWQSHRNFGVLVTVGAGMLMPLGLILLQLGLGGIIILSCIYGGAVFFIIGSRLEGKIKALAKNGQTDKATSATEGTSAAVAGAGVEATPAPAKAEKTFWTPTRRAWALVGLGVLIPVVFVAAIMTPPSNHSDEAGKSAFVIAELHELVPAGFEVGEIRGSSFGIDYSNSNSSFSATRVSSEPDFAAGCREFIDWGVSIGVNSWLHDPTYARTALAGNEDRAQVACVYTLSAAEIDPVATDPGGSSMFQLYGLHQTGEVIAPFFMEVHVSNQPGGNPLYTWNAQVSTNYGSGDDGSIQGQPWDPVYLKYQEALTALGGYRLANPEVVNFDEASFEAATEGLTGISLTPFVSDDGLIHRMAMEPVPNNGAWLPICVSIDPWSEEFAGVPDIGKEYTVGILQSPANLNHFGRAVLGDCPAD